MHLPLRRYFKLFGKYLKPLTFQITILTFLMALTVAIDLVNPLIIERFINMAKAKEATRNLIIAAILFISAALTKQIVVIVSTYLSQNVGWTATNGLREDLVRHCINLDMGFHKSKKPGELIERLDGDVTALFNFFSKLFINLSNNVVLLFGILIVLFLKDYRIGIALSIFTIIAMIILWIYQVKGVKRIVIDRGKNAELYGLIGEQVSSTEDIRSCGAVSYTIYRFLKFIKEWLPPHRKAHTYYGYMWGSTVLVFALGYAIAFTLSGFLYYNNIIEIGTVYLIITYTDLLERPIKQIRTQFQDLQKAGASIIRVEELFELKSAITDGTEAINSNDALEVILNKVNFKYEDGVTVLNNISLRIKAGKVLGLLGRTGSGKTTLSRLLVRLYDADGEIWLGNQNIKDLKLSEIRTKIAYVTQDVQLFKGTIRENLTFFNKNIEDKEILEAIDNMSLKSWFSTLPNGLDTPLDSNGGSLSSGEAQLISFIRVFLKKPQLIILDEASSRVDPITEKLIEQALQKLLVNRTCIIIAHRLWTVERADEILILDHGKIIEYGERKSLERDTTSRFYQLLQAGIEEVLE